MVNTDNPNRPDYIRPEVLEAGPDLELIHDLLGGTRQMHDHAALYIPKWKDESDSVWHKRSKIEQLYEGLGRTLSASVGKLFAVPPKLSAPVL
jgi:hypothetical protein